MATLTVKLTPAMVQLLRDASLPVPQLVGKNLYRLDHTLADRLVDEVEVIAATYQAFVHPSSTLQCAKALVRRLVVALAAPPEV